MKRLVTGLLAMILFVMVVIPVAAAGIPAVPQNRAVLDTAGLLSPAVIEDIARRNDALAWDTGGEIMFLTVDFVPLGQDIAGFAHNVFNEWGVGHAERNNGILLVIAAAEAQERYWLLVGDGISAHFGGAAIDNYLSAHFHDHFMAGDYDMAVTSLFNALSESLYALFPPAVAAAPPAPGERQLLPAGGGIEFGQIIVAAVVIILLLSIFSAISRAGRRGRGVMGGPMMPRRRFWGFGRMGGGFMGGFFMGRASANRQNRGPRPPAGPPTGGFGRGGGFTGGGGGGFTRGGGYSRGGGGGMSRGGGRRR